jgi:hypothetical protein
MCCTVASKVWLAFCRVSSFTAFREKTKMMANATNSNVAKAAITIRLSLKDKVRAIFLVIRGISAAKIIKNFGKVALITLINTD